MKKQIFFFATMLLSIISVAQQRTFTKSVSTNYTAKQVTFTISWAAGSRGTYSEKVYNSKVWVLVDYQEVRNGVPSGNWQRATIDVTNLPANCTKEGLITTGFWYQGQTSGAQNATITVKLTNVPAQFKWCAFATDYPPNATYSNGSYTLQGTPPFEIIYNSGNTTTTNNRFFSAGTITAVTDATKCPGIINCAGRDQLNVSSCCPGLTVVGGYCRNLNADNAFIAADCGIEIKKVDGTNSNWTCENGWRLPSVAELKCIQRNLPSTGMAMPAKTYRTNEDANWDYSCAACHGGTQAVYVIFSATIGSWCQLCGIWNPAAGNAVRLGSSAYLYDAVSNSYRCVR